MWRYWILALSICSAMPLFSDAIPEAKPDREQQTPSVPFKEKFSETLHKVTIDGKELTYKATAGNLIIKDANGKDRASIFFIAYTKEGVANLGMRPVTFCTNGGPGSSSIWLHMGVLGPQRVALVPGAETNPPFRYTNNDQSILDTTDLVFIDPVSTGYSIAAPGVDVKDFHGVDEDIKSIANFIRLYLTRYMRWESPKFFCGESYGTTRAAGLVSYLHKTEDIYFNGIVLVSAILAFQTHDFDPGNDLPCIVSLPSYTAAAWYHKKLAPDLQAMELPEVLKEVQGFAINEYALALMKGDVIPQDSCDLICSKLARYTGLTPDYVKRTNLRIQPIRFMKELLRDSHRTIGRFDSRFLGIDSDAAGESFEYDPSMDAVSGAYTSAFNQYVRKDLKWDTDAPYEILADVWPWKYGEKANNRYLNVAEDLREVMTRNPKLQVFVASGYYDLATPFFATDYTLNHLGLDVSLRPHITTAYYEAGHMMYIHQPSLVKFKQDLTAFIDKTLQR